MTLLAGCGFRVTTSSDIRPVDDAPLDDAVEVDDAPDDADAAIDAVPVDAPWSAADCPINYVVVGNQLTRYRIDFNAVGVRAHHEVCTAEGTHLAVIETQQEASALRQFIDGTNGLPTTSFGPFVYIGAAQRPNQALRDAGWFSATGPFNQSFWNSNEPNDGTGGENNEENFAAIWRDQNLLVDLDHDIPVAGLCECDGKEITSEFKTLIEAAPL
jgi:hypothetical protein